MTAKFKTVKEFLTWLEADIDYDEKYLYFVFTTYGIEISGANSLEEYQEGDIIWGQFIDGQFFEDFKIVTLYLDGSWAVGVEIEEGFSIDVPYQLENIKPQKIKIEEPSRRVILL